jgi:hypothetical protein
MGQKQSEGHAVRVRHRAHRRRAQRFSVKFYLVAMLFILFDIEAIFLYPWAVVYKQLKMFAFVEMLVFVVLIWRASSSSGRKACWTGLIRNGTTPLNPLR